MRLSGFVHRQGTHCGSSALAASLRHQGLDLPEALVFGLGAGLGFSLHDGDTRLTPPQPARILIGRSASFERDLADSLGFSLDLEQHVDADAALSRARVLIDEGQTVLAYTDLFHLPYLGAHGHWFGHLVNLIGIDAAVGPGGNIEVAVVSDNERPTLETVPLGDFQQALGTDAPVKSGNDVTLLVVRDVRPFTPIELRKKAISAIELQAMRMSGDAESSGVIGLDTFADEVRSWESREDWKRCARLAGQAIELRGCGGGFFRRLWSQFLGEVVKLGETRALELVPATLASADAFTALALELQRVYETGTPRLAEAAARAQACVEAETALWKQAAQWAEIVRGA